MAFQSAVVMKMTRGLEMHVFLSAWVSPSEVLAVEPC